jgi:hypothetical protein
MKLSFLIPSTVFTMAMGSCVLAANDTAGIGPAVMTYSEIAAALSRHGRRVLLAPSLAHRAAFVSLKPRGWETLRVVLSAGLQVSFKKNDAGIWVMEPDQALQSRDQARLDRYLSLLKRSVTAQALASATRYKAGDREKLRADTERLRSHIEGDLGMDLSEKERSAWGMSQHGSNMALHSMEAALTPGGWLSIQQLSRGGWSARKLLAARVFVTVRPGSQLDESGLSRGEFQANWFLKWQSFAEYDAVVHGVSFEPIDRVLQGEVWLTSRYGAVAVPGPPFRLPFEKRTLKQTFAELGPEASRSMSNEERATKQALLTRALKGSFRIESSWPISSLSQVVECWSRSSRSEAVMELFPTREHMIAHLNGERVSLAGLWSGEAFNNRLWQTWKTMQQKQDADREDFMILQQRRFPWSLHLTDGVLIVSNQLAFLDHGIAPPLENFLKFEQAVRKESGPVHRPIIALDPLLAFCRSITPQENGAWSQITTGLYRGLPIESIAHLNPFIKQIDRLKDSEKARFWNELHRYRSASLSLGSLEDKSLRELRNSLRWLGVWCPVSWHPDFERYLRQCRIVFGVDADLHGMVDCWRLVATVDDPTWIGTRTVSPDARAFNVLENCPELAAVRLPKPKQKTAKR